LWGGGWERKFQEAGEKWAEHLEWIEGEELLSGEQKGNIAAEMDEVRRYLGNYD